jgi:hypothetical protein
MALQRLFGLGGVRRPLGEQDTAQVSLRGADARPAPVVVTAVQAYYGATDAPNAPAGFPYGVLEDLQAATRPPGIVLLFALLLTLAGAALGLGPPRRFAIVLATTGWLPVLYGTWAGALFNWRYVLLGIPFIAVAAFGAVSALLARRAARKPHEDTGVLPDRDDVVLSPRARLVS